MLNSHGHNSEFNKKGVFLWHFLPRCLNSKNYFYNSPLLFDYKSSHFAVCLAMLICVQGKVWGYSTHIKNFAHNIKCRQLYLSPKKDNLKNWCLGTCNSWILLLVTAADKICEQMAFQFHIHCSVETFTCLNLSDRGVFLAYKNMKCNLNHAMSYVIEKNNH